MGQNNFISIKEALVKMFAFSQNLLMCFNLFQDKSHEIFKHIKGKYNNTNEQIYINIVESFPSKSNELKKMRTYLSEIINNLNSLNFEDVSSQYETFLINEVVNYDWNNTPYMDSNSLKNVYNFMNKLDAIQFFYESNDYQAIDALNFIVFNHEPYFTTLRNKISSMKIFDSIKNVKNNIVMIGANGSGKSTFARHLKGILSNNITILSAQHLLVYRKPESISINNNEIELVHQFQSNDKLGSDYNLINLFSCDFNNLISALFAENGEREHQYYANLEEKRDSILLTTIKIWKEIIPHRKLIYENYNIYVSTLEGIRYDFNFLSDGEKAAFYYIAHVLLAIKNNYIIVDEPESHLHLAICNKLWDILEQRRKDCKFIYITHNLDFATTRSNKTLLWNKSFTPPFNWDVIQLQSDECIPDRLLMEIVGSRKNILFCEGDDKSSLDFKLYSILFSDYTIIPVGGHLNVINYCNAYNKNKQIYGCEAFGLIDHDCHLIDQINRWKENKVYTLPVNEIENLLCDEFILERACKQFCSPPDAIEKFKNNFFAELDKDKGIQAIWYANNIINCKFKDNMLKEQRDLNSLKLEFHSLFDSNLVQNNYDKRLAELKAFIDSKDYGGALKICNFKGKLINSITKVIVNDYRDRIFPLISQDVDLKEKIKAMYFSDINIE